MYRAHSEFFQQEKREKNDQITLQQHIKKF